MSHSKVAVFVVFAGLTLLLTNAAYAVEKTFVGGNRSWTSADSWTPAGMPAAGDDVVVNSGTLDLSTAYLLGATGAVTGHFFCHAIEYQYYLLRRQLPGDARAGVLAALFSSARALDRDDWLCGGGAARSYRVSLGPRAE